MWLGNDMKQKMGPGRGTSGNPDISGGTFQAAFFFSILEDEKRLADGIF